MSDNGRIQLVREGDRGALRSLFSENIQVLYDRAKAYLGVEAAAKDTLKQILTLAQERCADCPEDALPWLCALCDEVLGIEPAPAEVPAEVPAEETVDIPEEIPQEAVENAQAPCEEIVENMAEPVEEAVENPQEAVEASVEETVEQTTNVEEAVQEAAEAPAAETVSCVSKAKISTEGYDMEQDEWLMKLRAEKRRALQEEPSPAPEVVEIPEEKPTAVENPVETEDFFPEKKQKVGVFGRIMIVLLVIVILLLAWAALGLLMNLEILPFRDLGYSWFNTHIMDMF